MRPRQRLGVRGLVAAAATIVAGVLVVAAPQQSAAPTPAPASDPVDYNWDVRPILSENCFQCHGPDEKARRAGLRLDQAEGATLVLNAQTGRRAIVPGNPDDSELMRRVTHPTVAVRMPPAQTNKTLSPEKIETLRRWIAEGAHYKPHWAFIPPARTTPPGVTIAGRPLTDIDRFVVRTLQREGLQLSAEADKETLINRVTLILTGLPPALADVDAFVKDTSPNAYEKLVDRLLAAPAMASTWRPTGPMSRATRRATASSTITTIDCSGPIATG